MGPVSKPRIRAARTEELAELVALENRTFDSDRLSVRQWRRHVASPSAAVRVAIDRGRLAGASVVFFRARGRVARLYSIAVAAEARGHGLGEALLADAERVARSRGAAVLRLEVREDNLAARHLYERSGYRAIGAKPGYYEDGTGARRYEKNLDSRTRSRPRLGP